MADDKGGSDTGDKGENKAAKIAIEEALAKIPILERAVADRDKTIAELTAQLRAANDVLEAQSKAELIGQILPRSNFSVEDLSVKSTEELQHIRATLDQAKLPTYKNIRFGVPSAADQAPNLTVGDISVVTAAKRKAQGGT